MSKLVLSPSERSIINKSTIPLDAVFESNGVLLRCVLRPDDISHQDACSGCFYFVNNLTCPKSQCSHFGRTDGKNVWFVEVCKE